MGVGLIIIYTSSCTKQTEHTIGTASSSTCQHPFCARTTHHAGIDQKRTSSGTRPNVFPVSELRDEVARSNRGGRLFDQSPTTESKDGYRMKEIVDQMLAT